MILSSLPAEYENFCVAIESCVELPGPENLKIKLIEEEARRGETDTVENEITNKNEALITKKKIPHKMLKQKENYKQTKFNGNCHVCKKYGHRVGDCRNKTEKTMKRNDAMTAVALNTSFKESNVWCLDSGATIHICNNKDKFLNLNNERTQIFTATEESVKSDGKGQVKLKVNATNEVKLKEAILVPSFKNNLLSVSSITNNGYKVTFQKDSAVIRRPDGSIALRAKQENGLYIIKETTRQTTALLNEHEGTLVKWHQRLGHLNFNDVRKLKDHSMVNGINDRLNTVNPTCEICEKSKIHQKPYKTSEKKENEILGLVHSDISGPMRVSLLAGAKYFATFIDDKSRYIEIKPLKKKSEIIEAFKEYKTRVEKMTGHCIKKLRTDNAKEYLSKEFNEFLKKEGITRQLTVEYTPQKNGVAERANRRNPS